VNPAGLHKAPHRGAFLFWRAFQSGLVALALISVWTASDAPASETARVAHVIDGDTFVLVDGRHVRLIGINAPELGKDGRPDQPLAREARQYLAELIDQQRVSLSSEQENHDRYGRWLLHARLSNGDSVEEKLLLKGLAWVVAIPPNIGQLEKLLRAENMAREAKRGVWNVAAYRPVQANRLTTEDTGFRFIEGKVLLNTQGRHSMYFDIAPRVALVIPREAYKKYFEDNAHQWIGRTVVARGWLTESRGRLHLRVPHPAMLTWRD